MRGLRAPAKQNHNGSSFPREVHAVTFAFEDPQFEHPAPDRSPITREPERQAVDLSENPRLRTGIPELRYPPIEWDRTARSAVLADLDHNPSVAYRLQPCQRDGPYATL